MEAKTKYKYRIIAEDLQRQIMSGNLTGRKFLPSELLLSKRYNVNRRTVRQAVNSLEELNIISPVEKKKRRILAGNDGIQENTIAFVAYGRLEQKQFRNLSAHHLFDELVMLYQRHRHKVIKVLFDKGNPDYIPEIIDSDGIDLFIIFGDIDPEIFRQRKKRFIMVDSKPETDAVCVNIDGSTIAMDAYRYLVNKGNVNIGFMRYTAKYYPFAEMGAGYRTAAEFYSRTSHYFEIPLSAGAPLQQFIDYFEKESERLKKLDGLILSTNTGIDKIYMSLKSIGISVPSGLSVIAIGGNEDSEAQIPRLTCYENDYRTMAKTIWEVTHAVSVGLISNNLRISTKAQNLHERDSVIDRGEL